MNSSSVAHGAVVLLLKSMWSSFCNLLGAFGLRPLYLGIFLVGLLALSVITTLVNGLRGRTKFTLDRQPGQDERRA